MCSLPGDRRGRSASRSRASARLLVAVADAPRSSLSGLTTAAEFPIFPGICGSEIRQLLISEPKVNRRAEDGPQLVPQ